MLIREKEFKQAEVKLNKAKKILQEIGTKRFIDDIDKCLEMIKT